MACVINVSEVYAGFRTDYEHLAQTPLDHEFFWPQLAILSQRAVSHVREQLHKAIPELESSDIAVVCTGSDSRLEKCGLGSPVEIIVIFSEENNPLQTHIFEQIRTVCESLAPLTYPDVDHKTLGIDLMSTYERAGIEPRVIPTRAFDAAFIAGNPTTFAHYKRTLTDELIQKRINLSFFEKKFLKEAIQNLRSELSGSQRKKPLAILNTGVVTYEKCGGRGLKHDILRTIQYSCALKIFLGIQNGCIPAQDLLTLPQNVPERIVWLWKQGLTALNERECTELLKTYTLATYWYVLLNKQVVEAGDPQNTVTKMNVPIEILRSLIQGALDLSKKLIS